MEFTGDQTEMINETIVEAITGAIMAMIAELTEDWIGNQSKMINKTTMEMTSELILEMILELTSDQVEIGDPDGCPLTTIDFLTTSRMKSQKSANQTISTGSAPSSNPSMPATGNVTLKSAVKMPPVPVKTTNLTNLQSPTANRTTGKTTPAPTKVTPAPTTTITTPVRLRTTLDDPPLALPTATSLTSPLNLERTAS